MSRLNEYSGLRLRLAEETDAGFILKLRLDKRYNRYLSAVENDLEKQRAWLRAYKEREKQGGEFYFIVEYCGRCCGTARIYDLRKDSFRWGSWILNEDKPAQGAIWSMLKVYEFGFESLKMNYGRFEVMKENRKVQAINLKFGAVIVGEDEHQYHFQVTREKYEKALLKYRRIFQTAEG